MSTGHPKKPPIPRKSGRAADDVAGYMPGRDTEDDDESELAEDGGHETAAVGGHGCESLERQAG